MPGVLYIVATPIGNLEDITLRALRVLKEVALIAAEDTRRTQALLSRYDLRTPLTSYHEHNERTKAPALVGRLARGESIALVSDAGTPAISDPGYRLVVAAVAAGIQVTPIPGPSALIAALSAAALPSDRFIFEGFLPARKTERRARLQDLRSERRTLIFYEAPHRVADLLRDIFDVLGDREITVAREVSKVHEEFLRGRAGELVRRLAGREVKGELTLVVDGSREEPEVSQAQLEREIAALRSKGMRVKQIAEVLGEKFGYPKREIYRLALRLDEIVNH
jgi:16S rRNA (cytidine1402-2'-O)-methyltransferase